MKGKRLRILGREYWINTELPEEYVEELAEYLNNKLKEIDESIYPLDRVVLAALNIVDELFEERKAAERSLELAGEALKLLEKENIEGKTTTLGWS